MSTPADPARNTCKLRDSKFESKFSGSLFDAFRVASSRSGSFRSGRLLCVPSSRSRSLYSVRVFIPHLSPDAAGHSGPQTVLTMISSDTAACTTRYDLYGRVLAPAVLGFPEPENLALSSAAGELPHGPHQKALALIWQRLLKVKKLSLDDNFFEMGGHSLMTIKLIHEIEEATGEQLSIADVFENPTIREFSLLLENATWINAEPAKKIALARFWDFISRRSV